MRRWPTALKLHQGSALLEALISVLIFSVGIISLMGLQAASIKNSIDAKYRGDAAYLANQIIGNMWVDRASIDAYAHKATAGAVCAPGGADSGNINVQDWLTDVSNSLPGAVSGVQQIQVASPSANTKLVTVTICWRSPSEANYHNFLATAQINTD